MTTIRILSDDLTGALDSATAFAGNIPVYLDMPPADDKAPISAVSTATRDIAQGKLTGQLAPCLSWLQSGRIAFKKVDSLLRGNSFHEIAWLAKNGNFDKIVFAPAFPVQGRVTHDGMHWLVKQDNGPQTQVPLLEKNLTENFAELDIAIEENRSSASGTLIWIPHVTVQSDLESLAKLAEKEETANWLWCGSAGLAQALAVMLKLAPSAKSISSQACESQTDKTGITVLISASHHPVTREQWAVLTQHLTPDMLVRYGEPGSLDDALGGNLTGMHSAWFDLAPESRLAATAAASRLSEQMARIVQALPVPKQVAVIGGDTLLEVCRATGTQHLTTEAASQSGWGCARLVGGKWDGVLCHSRSGAFGMPSDLLNMLRHLGVTQ